MIYETRTSLGPSWGTLPSGTRTLQDTPILLCFVLHPSAEGLCAIEDDSDPGRNFYPPSPILARRHFSGRGGRVYVLKSSAEGVLYASPLSFIRRPTGLFRGGVGVCKIWPRITRLTRLTLEQA